MFSYSSSEFADMVYGGASRKLSQPADFACSAWSTPVTPAFSSGADPTLRLDKLRSSEVKGLLLQIFRRDLPDASIDFKAEWDKAFADLNAERSQYLAAERLKAPWRTGAQAGCPPGVAGKLLCWRPMIDEGPGPVAAALRIRQQTLQHELQQCDGELDRLREQDRQAGGSRASGSWNRSSSARKANSCGVATAFCSGSPKAAPVLEARRRDVQAQRDALVVRIGQAQSRTPAAIERELPGSTGIRPSWLRRCAPRAEPLPATGQRRCRPNNSTR